MERYGMVLKSMEKCGKVWKGFEKYGKVCKSKETTAQLLFVVYFSLRIRLSLLETLGFVIEQNYGKQLKTKGKVEKNLTKCDKISNIK